MQYSINIAIFNTMRCIMEHNCWLTIMHTIMIHILA